MKLLDCIKITSIMALVTEIYHIGRYLLCFTFTIIHMEHVIPGWTSGALLLTSKLQ